MLTVIDEYTREGLCVAVSPKMGAAEVLEALYPLLLKHGKPEFIRSDNGPEFASENFQTWLKRLASNPSASIQAVLGRTDIMSDSMERCAGKC